MRRWFILLLTIKSNYCEQFESGWSLKVNDCCYFLMIILIVGLTNCSWFVLSFQSMLMVIIIKAHYYHDDYYDNNNNHQTVNQVTQIISFHLSFISLIVLNMKLIVYILPCFSFNFISNSRIIVNHHYDYCD